MRTCVLVALLVVSCCATVYAGAPDVAFERIDLKHLPVCEIAPLLGPQFGYAKELCEPGTRHDAGVAREFRGVGLIAASHPSSRYLLAAGTAQGVAELRGFVERLDAPLPRVRIAAEVYPAAPADITGWTYVAPGLAGIDVRARVVPASQKLRFPALPRDQRPHEIAVSGYCGRPEFMPLPAFANWPQVLLAVAADGKRKGTLVVGVGGLNGERQPLGALKEAWALRNTLRVNAEEVLILLLKRENSAVTVVLRASAVGMQ